MRKWVIKMLFIFCACFTAGCGPEEPKQFTEEELGWISTDVKYFNYITEDGIVIITGVTDRTLRNVRVPYFIEEKNVKEIGDHAFYGCTLLWAADLPESINSIGKEAFAYCVSMVNVHLPRHIKEIKDATFNNCQALENVSIPRGVVSIGDLAFANCTALKNIYIPESVQSISKSAFEGSEKVVIYGVAGSEAEKYANENGIPFVVKE